MAVPTPVQAGDIVGYHFPTSSARHPHPGIVLQIIKAAAARADLCAKRGMADIPGTQICVLLMVSHTPPPKGEYGELIPNHRKTGTTLDAARDLYVCYRHFDAAFIPGQERPIVSRGGPYLGRMEPDALLHYRAQLRAIQAFLKGHSFRLPEGVFVA